ncbi:DUF4349 domain-containing protein [Rufibacter glacialis]|nr:DUF4349 domain-containing protein [Rufibacter glacialis]
MKTVQTVPVWMLLLGIFSLLMACESSPKQSSSEAMEATASPDATAENKETPPQQNIIKHAAVRFQVQDMASTTQYIESTARKHQGLITNTGQHTEGDEHTIDFEIRVSPQNFLPLLDQLQQHSTKLDYRTLSTDDVSLEMVDVAARLKAKRTTEERFLSLLKEAKTIEEIIKVEYELQRIREDIERADARLRHLSDQTAYSTIKLSIYQIVPMSFSERVGLGSRFYNAFGTGWQLFISLLVGVCYLWPVVLLLLGFWLARKHRMV